MNKSLAVLALASSLWACTTTRETLSQAAVGAGIGTAGATAAAVVVGAPVFAGAAVGAAVGAGAEAIAAEANKDRPAKGVVVECKRIAPKAELGASVPGLSGAAWADLDGDNCVDGYVLGARYLKGLPPR